MTDCVDIEISSQGAKVRLPGGPELSVMTPQTAPSNIQITKNLLTQANAALAPLAPIFKIIDAVLAVKGFAEAVPDALGPPPDPGALASAIGEVVNKASGLASLVPQLSVPLLAIDTIDAVILALNGIIDQLNAIVIQEAKIAAAEARGSEPGNEAILQITVCANDLNAKVKQGTNEGMKPINSLLRVLQLLMDLIGGPAIPTLDDLPEDSTQAIAQLESVVKTLQDVRGAIPVP